MASDAKIDFKVTLDENNWRPHFNGWECSAMAIPGTEIKSIYRNSGKELFKGMWVPNEDENVIVWQESLHEKPESLLVSFEITTTLSTTEDVKRATSKATQLWKWATSASSGISALLIAILSSPLVNTIAQSRQSVPEDPPPPIPIATPTPTPSAQATATPTPTPPLPSEELNKNQALELVNSWLTAKSRIFAPPFDKQLLGNLVSSNGPLYEEITSPNKGIDYLRSSDSFYTFETPEVTAYSFFSSGENPELKVNVNEDYTLHIKNKRSDTKNNNQVFFYSFEKEDGQWKIYDYIEEAQR